MFQYSKPQAVKYLFLFQKCCLVFLLLIFLVFCFYFLLNLSAVRLHTLSGGKENGALV